LVNHFQRIAKEPHQDRFEAIQRISQHIPKLFTEDQNVILSKPIAKEEIDQLVQEMPNGKSPGPDGFTVEFFKAHWDVVKYDIYGVVEDSRHSASILKDLNATMITLIPKENESRTPDYYRPIALCNLVYKIISKVKFIFQRNLSNILGFECKMLLTKYLGIPLTDKACKNATWEGVISKLQERVKNWTYRALNLA
jgi:hypothetical protein